MCLTGRAPPASIRLRAPRLRIWSWRMPASMCTCAALLHTVTSRCLKRTNAAFHCGHGPSDVTIYGAHSWPPRPATCFPLLPNALRRMRSLVFIPRHGRLGDHHIHSAGQMPSIYGVCFHHWETQQTLDNLGPFSLFVHCLSVTRCPLTVVGDWRVAALIRHFDVKVRWKKKVDNAAVPISG